MSKFSDALKKIQQNQAAPPPLPEPFFSKSETDSFPGNRRREEREKCFVQARAVITSPEEEIWINQARILNFSGRGILFELEHPLSGIENLLHPRTFIRVRVILTPGKQSHFEVEGRIIRYARSTGAHLGIELKADTFSFSEELNSSLRTAV